MRHWPPAFSGTLMEVSFLQLIDRDENNKQLMDEAIELRRIIADEKEALNEESEDLGIMIR